MPKFPSKLPLLILFIFIHLLSISVRAEESTPNTTPKQSTSILQAILNMFKSPESRFITRGDQVCLISPGNLGEKVIWSDRPLFIWQGKIPQSEIHLSSSPTNYQAQQNEQLAWTETVPPNTQTIAYAGKQLQPGITYDWEFISYGKTYRQTIILMDQPQRKAIAAELTALENELRNNDTTPEDIAIAKANYFIQRKLGSDALQQLYSVENPSPNLTNHITDIEQYLCNLNN